MTRPSDSDSAAVLDTPLPLGRGAPIPNRLMKSAMSEVLGSKDHAPTDGLARLYRTWALGGIGLSVTGNVMIDRRALGEPGNVVVEDDRNLPELREWATAGTSEGGHLWMQINHPGKQTPKFLSREPVAPSAVPLGHGLEKVFATPRELTDDEIEALVERYGRTAGVAKQAGFTGVQIHGAHGYLVSQFLSAHHNRRTDRWGGSLENRTAFVLAVYRAMRQAVGDDYPVSIKINSADFQKGGFTEEESLDVISALVEAGIDLIEVSGGTYEAPAMTGARQQKESTRLREAYFLAFAESVRKRVDIPLAVTGGFRTAEGMVEAVRGGSIDVVGLARPLALEPNLPNRVFSGEPFVSKVRRLSTGSKTLDTLSMLDISFYEVQLARMAAGKAPKPTMWPMRSVATSMFRQGLQTFKTRRSRSS